MESKIQKAIRKTRVGRAVQEKRIYPMGYNDIRVKNLIQRPTASRAIQEFCRMCSNYSMTGRNECPIKDCPLWPWRQGKSHMTEEEMAEWRDSYTEMEKKVEPELFKNRD